MGAVLFQDPKWLRSGNRVTFRPPPTAGPHPRGRCRAGPSGSCWATFIGSAASAPPEFHGITACAVDRGCGLPGIPHDLGVGQDESLRVTGGPIDELAGQLAVGGHLLRPGAAGLAVQQRRQRR